MLCTDLEMTVNISVQEMNATVGALIMCRSKNN